MKTLTFEQWRDSRYKNLSPDEEIECHDCLGSCEVKCDCCDNYSDCEKCRGEGTVLAGDCSEQEIKNSLTHEQYAAALQNDLTDLASYTGRNTTEVLAEHGFECYSLIESKRQIVELRL